MGVPFYFKKIFNNYPQILNDKYNQNNPHLFLDFNGIIHQCSHKVVNNIEFTEDDIFEEIKKYIYVLNDKFKPKLIYAAIDGVAPLSKIKQQRQRRFKTIFYQNKKDKLYLKHGEKINTWNSNCITPGTLFMKNLNIFLKNIDLNNLIISDSDERGEGEHKMFNYIKENRDMIDNIIIHGLDADLIFLSLLSNIKNITIFRDNNSVESFLTVDILRTSILSDLKLNIQFKITDEYSLIRDYILVCFLLGNDFLPKMNSLDIISNNGLNVIEETYIEILNQTNKFLVSESNIINNHFLKLLIHKLSQNELKNLNNANYKYINKKYFSRRSSTSKLEEDINKLEFYPLFNKSYIAYNNIFDWKFDYYNHYFNHIHDKNKIVEQYLIGIQWILEYYLSGKSPNNWFYPYLNSPFLDDIYNYLDKYELPKYIEENDIEITPNIQLLLVLHKSSHYLFPKSLQNVYNSELKYLYPTEFYIDTHLNTYLHQCIPFIPNFNVKKVNDYINKNC